MKSFIFIIPGYNNQWINKCFESISSNSYKNKRVVYIDDASTDKIIIPDTNFELTVIKNKKRLGPAYSRWIGIKEAKDNEIIIFLDGDDWLSHDKVLDYLNEQYRDKKIKWTVSNYRRYKNGKTNVIPEIIILPLKKDFPCRTHLRSGYANIWKNMPKKWIQFNGNFIQYMTDFNENLWAIKNIGQPTKLNGVLITYNCDNTKTTNEQSYEYKNKIKKYFLFRK